MKVKVEIDCTAPEARAFFGLPDFAPMQEAMVEEMKKRTLAEMDRFSPEALMKSWMTAPVGMQESFLKLFSGGLKKPSS